MDPSHIKANGRAECKDNRVRLPSTEPHGGGNTQDVQARRVFLIASDLDPLGVQLTCICYLPLYCVLSSLLKHQEFS